ncbi:MAG: hypothetical protein CL917_01875 [Deltaproteobacteria bacterium]|nr:hypothetical protein [Deltaproteobacteria bacterium]
MAKSEMDREIFFGDIHPDFQDVVRSLRRVLPKRGQGGAAVCVYHRGECVADIWAGTLDENGAPWQAETLALSWSTTKGVLSTLLHLWVDRGYADYDDPVARYWPAFAQQGKGALTLREILCHEAGLHRIGDMIEHAEEMLDWDRMIEVLEKQAPAVSEDRAPAYHGLTFGWLVGELVERIGGSDLRTQIQTELAQPLGLDGLYMGMPEEEQKRCARVIEKVDESSTCTLGRTAKRRQVLRDALGLTRGHACSEEVERALLPHGFESLDWNSFSSAETAIPALGGFFNARSLAKLYSALSTGRDRDDSQLLSGRTLKRASRIQNDSPGRVIPVSMQWRLGYHRVAVVGADAPEAFGHFGLGGSGAWVDPERELAVALVLNSGMGTPFGDTRIVRVSSAAIQSADRRAVAA